MTAGKKLGVFWRPLIFLAIAFVAAGCRADIAVDVMVERDGSGIVNVELLLDEEAAVAMVDLRNPGLALDDMAKAGWIVSETEDVDGGGARIAAAKNFGTADQFAEVMSEISREDGVFKEFELQRNRGFARVEYNVTGQIDTTGGLGAFSDTELEELLDLTLESADEDYETTPEKVGIEFSATLPGDVAEGDTNGLTAVDDGQTTIRWAVDLASENVASVRATSETRTVSALVFRGLAVVAGVLAVLLIVAQLLRRFGSDQGQPQPKPKARATAAKPGAGAPPTGDAAASTSLPDAPVDIAVPELASSAVDASAQSTSTRSNASASNSEASAAESRSVAGAKPATPPVHPSARPPANEVATQTTRAVMLDGMGVLYKEGDDINRLLIPFVRERGSIKTNDEIWAKARAMSLGRLTTTKFWKEVGVEGDATELDAAYVANHQLSTGVVRYTRALRDHGIAVGCMVNGSTTWAAGLRSSHSLMGLIEPWIVSGAVGVRKPDPPLLEVVRRLCELPPSDIRFIDDDLDILDVVRKAGYLTTWYSPEGIPEQARGHSLIRSFEAEAARLTGLLQAVDPESGE